MIKSFETSATVEDHGQVRLIGVPFAPGTEVQVSICEKHDGNANASPATPDESPANLRDVFTRVRARNTQSVGPLRREELYDRKVLR